MTSDDQAHALLFEGPGFMLWHCQLQVSRMRRNSARDAEKLLPVKVGRTDLDRSIV